MRTRRVILDYDKEGNLISLEVLDASRRVSEPFTVTLEMVTGQHPQV